MNLIARALVALDFSEMDNHLLSYSHLFSQVLNLDKIYFVHVIPDYFFSKSAELAFKGTVPVATPLDERIQSKIEEKVKAEFGVDGKELELAVDILEGRPYEKILQWTEVKQIDLLITGRKKKSDGSGLTAKRVSHRADCNVLFVPEGVNSAPEKILVPIDFSKHSVKALKAALAFKKVVPEIEIIAANAVRFLPTDYYFGLDNNPVYRKSILELAQKEYENFQDKYGLTDYNIKMVFLENTYNNTARHLNEYANNEEFDLVIMGAKGHSDFKNFLYGSVTERFVDLCEEIPVFVVR